MRKYATITGAISGFLLGCGLVAGLSWKQDLSKFDSNAWIADADGLQPKRLEMIRDIMERTTWDDMDSGEIQHLLGPPLPASSAGNVDTQPLFEAWDAVYPAGCATTAGSWADAFSAQCSHLCFKYNSTGHVTAIGWVRDT